MIKKKKKKKPKKTEHYMEVETEQTDFTTLKLPLATETQASLTV